MHSKLFGSGKMTRLAPDDNSTGLSTRTASPVKEESGRDERGGSEIAILFLVVSLFIGAISRQLLKRTRVPYTVALLIIGMGLGALDYATAHGLGALGQSIRLWSKIDPNLILYVFLPALLFESSFSMEIHQIKRCLSQMVLLAGPGVIISTLCLGVFHYYVFPYGWSWSVSLLLAGLLSATDPVAVVALLKDLGASKKLNTIIDGEALMNDGTAMVVFELFQQMTLGKHFSVGEVVKFLSQVALLAIGLGLAFGFISVLWLGYMYNDIVMEITLTVAASYFAFFIAQHVAKVSGVLAVMTVGMFLAAFAKTAFRGETQQAMHHFWTMVAYFSNTIIFILSGVVICENFLESQSLIEARDWGYLILLYIFLQLSRVIVVATLYPGLSYLGYGLSLKEALVLVWAGLRGAVSLALSLSVDAKGSVSKVTQAKFVFFTGGVVFLTLIINGSTTQFLLRSLGIEKPTETKKLVLEHVTYEMNRKALEAFEELGEDEELGPADLETIEKYISCLNRFPDNERPVHPHESAPNVDDRRSLQLLDTRLRFLNGVQAAYWQMLDEGRITETAAVLLMQSVDEALDKVAKQERISDWTGLQPHIHIPEYLKFLQSKTSILPQKLLTRLVVARLELGCYVSAAFLRAHVHVRRHLIDFMGETDIAAAVIKESEDESSEAKQFLENVRLTFSQVLRVVKTKQVVHAILLRLVNYIKSLEISGLLEERETIQLSDAVQLELKRLVRKPPCVQIQKGSDVLRDHPFIASLPSHVQARVVEFAKEYLKLKGNTVYTEGSKADGVWLIGSGVVKWTERASRQRRLLYPTFTHGSTLGLYEVLMGRTYICDVVADSLVQCFYVEGSKLLTLLQVEPRLEQRLWQESTLVLAKTILPETFDSVPMHELRLLIQNQSSMVSCIRGEVIDLRPGETSLLLDGFVKTDNCCEIIAPPSAILYPRNDSPAVDPENGVYFGSVLNIEARSRVVIFTVSLSSSTSSMSLLRASMRDMLCRTKPGSFEQTRMSESRTLALLQSKTRSYDSTTVQAGGIRSAGQLLSEQHTKRTRTTPPPSRSLSVGPGLENMRSIQIPRLPPRLIVRRNHRHQLSGDSSDASDAEDEHIVQIESPSSLFNNSFQR